MQLRRFGPASGEQYFVTFRNAHTASIPAGHWAAIDMVTAKNGYSVKKPLGKNLNRIAGVCMTTLAVGSDGPFQVHGPCTIARCTGATTINTAALTGGSPLVIATSGFIPTRFPITSAAAKAEYAKQGAIGYVMGANTAALYSAAQSATYTVFVDCF